MTRQPDPPDEAALRALAEQALTARERWRVYAGPDITVEVQLAGEASVAEREFRAAVTEEAVLALLTTIADLRARLAAVTAERDEALRLLNIAAPYICPTCGPNVKVDEDECCAACGADCVRSMDGTGALQSAEHQRDTARAALDDTRDLLREALKGDTMEIAGRVLYIEQHLSAYLDAALSAPEGRPDDDPGPECSICRRPGRHTHACE